MARPCDSLNNSSSAARRKPYAARSMSRPKPVSSYGPPIAISASATPRPPCEQSCAERSRPRSAAALRASQKADHPDHWRRVPRAGGTLVIEGDVPTGDRCLQRPAGVGDAATTLLELVKDRRPLGLPKFRQSVM